MAYSRKKMTADCPDCYGHGQVDISTFEDDSLWVTCLDCHGTGINPKHIQEERKQIENLGLF